MLEHQERAPAQKEQCVGARMLMMLECFSSGIRGQWLSQGLWVRGTLGQEPNVLYSPYHPEAVQETTTSDYSSYGSSSLHTNTFQHYLDLFYHTVISGLSGGAMAMEHYQQPQVGLRATGRPGLHRPQAWE